MGRCKPLGSRNSFLSYVSQLSGANPVSLFTLRSGPGGRWLLLALPQLLSNHHGVWQLWLDLFWEPSFTFGGQKLLMAVTFLVYWYGRRYFHSTRRKWVKFCFFFLKEAKRAVMNPLTSSGVDKEDLTKRNRSRKGENKRMISSWITASSFLAVQWLRLSTSIARGVGSIPSRGT